MTRPNQGLSTCSRDNLGSRLVNNVNVKMKLQCLPGHLTLATGEGIQELLRGLIIADSILVFFRSGLE